MIRAVDLGGLEARSAALILSGEEGGELDVSVLAVPVRAAGDHIRVALVVDVEGETAETPEEAGEPPVTEVYAYALDEEQEIGGFLTQGFALEPDERRSVKFFGHLDLAPGEYSLRVLVLRRSRERMGLRARPLTVPPPGEIAPPVLAPERSLVRWVLVRQAAGDGDEPAFPLTVDGRPVIPATRERRMPELEAPGPAAVPAERPRLRSDLTRAYLAVLRQLAAGDGAAGEALAEMERTALGRTSNEALAESFLGLVARLVRIERESLVPLLHQYELLYRERHRHRRYALATHSRILVFRLAATYVESGGSRSLAASALASLAGYLQEIAAMPEAQAVFEHALEYDAEDEATLLGLASIRETYGDYPAAAELLKRLLAAHPENDEARLRRAVCLRRLGSTREAARLLGGSLAGGDGVRDWVRAVAYQELAGLYLEQNRLDDAAALLGEAVERMPRVQRLYLQLASVFDLMDRPAAARDTLARLDPRSGRDADSPRLVYSREPRAAVAAARDALAAAAGDRLDALAGALARIGKE